MTTITTTHSLHITDDSGDTQLLWDPADTKTTDAARIAFDTAHKKGMLAYAVETGSGGSTGEVIRTFDATQEKIVMVPQTVGG